MVLGEEGWERCTAVRRMVDIICFLDDILANIPMQSLQRYFHKFEIQEKTVSWSQAEGIPPKYGVVSSHSLPPCQRNCPVLKVVVREDYLVRALQ
jgi:hypothetical protein